MKNLALIERALIEKLNLSNFNISLKVGSKGTIELYLSSTCTKEFDEQVQVNLKNYIAKLYEVEKDSDEADRAFVDAKENDASFWDYYQSEALSLQEKWYQEDVDKIYDFFDFDKKFEGEHEFDYAWCFYIPAKFLIEIIAREVKNLKSLN